MAATSTSTGMGGSGGGSAGGSASYASAASGGAYGQQQPSQHQQHHHQQQAQQQQYSPALRPGSSGSGSTGASARRSASRDSRDSRVSELSAAHAHAGAGAHASGSSSSSGSSSGQGHGHGALGLGYAGGAGSDASPAAAAAAASPWARPHTAQRSLSLSAYPRDAGSPGGGSGGGGGSRARAQLYPATTSAGSGPGAGASSMVGSYSQGGAGGSRLLETMDEHYAEGGGWSPRAAALGGESLGSGAYDAMGRAAQRHRATSSAAALSLHHAAVQDDLARPPPSGADWARALTQQQQAQGQQGPQRYDAQAHTAYSQHAPGGSYAAARAPAPGLGPRAASQQAPAQAYAYDRAYERSLSSSGTSGRSGSGERERERERGREGESGGLDSYGARAFSPQSGSSFSSVSPFAMGRQLSSSTSLATPGSTGSGGSGSAGAEQGSKREQQQQQQQQQQHFQQQAQQQQQPRRAVGFNVSGPGAQPSVSAPGASAGGSAGLRGAAPAYGSAKGSSALSLDDLAADLGALDVRGGGGNGNSSGSNGGSGGGEGDASSRKVEMRVPSSQAARQGAHAFSMPGYSPHDHVHLFAAGASPAQHAHGHSLALGHGHAALQYGAIAAPHSLASAAAAARRYEYDGWAGQGQSGSTTLVSSPADRAGGGGGASAFGLGGSGGGNGGGSRFRAASIGPLGVPLSSGLASGQETPLARPRASAESRAQSFHLAYDESRYHRYDYDQQQQQQQMARSPASEDKVPGTDLLPSSPAAAAAGLWHQPAASDADKLSTYSSSSSLGGSGGQIGMGMGMGRGVPSFGAPADYYASAAPPLPSSDAAMHSLAALGLPQLSDYAMHSLATLGPLAPPQGGGGGGGFFDGAASLQELGKGVPLASLPGEMPLYIVEFKQGRTDLYFKQQWGTHEDFDVFKGDLVVVEADRGKDLGTVVNDSINVAQVQSFLAHQSGARGVGGSSMMSGGGGGGGLGASGGADGSKVRLISPKRLYGRATPADTALLYSKAQDEERALQLCVTKVTQRGLPMQVIAAEMQWDRRKLTFYYTANVRVDFRDLVKELFRLYKTRIWMCNIGHPNGP